MSSSSAREQKGGGDRVDALSATPQLSYARTRDGVTLAFAVTGQGPTLGLVPSVPFSNLQMEYGNPVMRQVYGELASRVTLLQYDGRGTGHSQRDVVDLSLEAMLADLEAVVDQAGVGQVGPLGQYSSCAHPLAYTARDPDGVRRLVLFGGSDAPWDA